MMMIVQTKTREQENCCKGSATLEMLPSPGQHLMRMRHKHGQYFLLSVLADHGLAPSEIKMLGK